WDRRRRGRREDLSPGRRHRARLRPHRRERGLQPVTGRWWLVLALAGAALSLEGPAIAADLTREQALAAIADTRDVETRRLGVLALGERGLMADMPQLSQALRDVDPLVRAFAENTMWRVWGPAGDDALDHPFAAGGEQMGAPPREAAGGTVTGV